MRVFEGGDMHSSCSHSGWIRDRRVDGRLGLSADVSCKFHLCEHWSFFFQGFNVFALGVHVPCSELLSSTTTALALLWEAPQALGACQGSPTCHVLPEACAPLVILPPVGSFYSL